MFDLQQNSPIPISRQLYLNIRKTILIGALKENDWLPSVRKIAQELMINPNTVHKVYQELEKDGFLVSVPQKGIYVNKVSDAIRKEYQEEIEETFKQSYKNLIELSLDKSYILNLIN